MNDDYFVPLNRIGARVNGTTNMDRTNFFEGVPSEDLPLALWLESDRMGYLLDALDQTKLDNQKLVVRNERRQSYENRPYGEVWIWLLEELFPPAHPYHTATIGKHEDIDAATLDDVKAFFRTWYLPNNASLALCGDFDPVVAKSLVYRWFAGLAKGPKPQPAQRQPAVLLSEKVVRKYDDVPLRKVWMAWFGPPLYEAGDAELDILSSVLSDGKESRLWNALVHDQQIAKDISAYEDSNKLASIFIIEATAAEGHTTDEVVAGVDAILTDLRANAPTAEEIDVARVNWEARFYDGLIGIQSKADRLNAYNMTAHDPGYLEKDLARYQGVTTQSVQRTMRTWLIPDRRLLLHVLPKADEPPAAPAPAAEAPPAGGQ
jgi:predicted Zn-dependent peptidase